jgi:hypothetical protein
MVSIRIRPHLWIWWANIAVDEERAASEARHEALRLGIQGEGFGDVLHRETTASMIGVSASAHALDGLYGVVASIIPKRDTGTRWSTILETFKRAFVVRGRAGGGAWAREFEWLFKLRDSALHHDEEDREPVPHPTGTSVSWATAEYSVESVSRAVDLLFDVLQTAAANPRPALEPWAADYRNSVEAILVRRQ